MAATLGMVGHRKYVERWQMAWKEWVATCPAHCRSIYRVCRQVVEVKARMRVDAKVKMLERRSQLNA